MELSPIILFIYNREQHTRRTLEALQKNFYADESMIYVYADGPKENATIDELKKITLTRAVIGEAKWCKEVILITREKNMNLEDNVILGITEVINKHGKAIILEDDIITSPFFLKYCNDGLELFKDFKQVFAINGFMYPIDYDTDATTFLCPMGTNPWGWATWADRWSHFEYAPKFVDELEKGILLKNRFNFGNITQFQILKNLNTWDLRWYYTSFIRNGLGVFPTKSLTYNIGFDGSGTHDGFGVNDQKLYTEPIILSKETAINLKYYSKFLSHFTLAKESTMRKIINEIKKKMNYKNYNVWWNEPGQKLY
jgi:hypothetical protein